MAHLPPQPPPPTSSILTLLSTLSNPNPLDHSLHTAALSARDEALASPQYSDLCLGFCRVLACQGPECVDLEELKAWRAGDKDMFDRCCGWMEHAHNGNEEGKKQAMIMWSTLRQMAGLSLKNALVSPPAPKNAPTDALGRARGRAQLSTEAASEIKNGLLRCITDSEGGVRSAASTCIARCCTVAGAVEQMDAFNVSKWGELVPFLLQCIIAGNAVAEKEVANASAGALLTLRKLLEDIPNRMAREAPSSSFNDLVPALLQMLGSIDESFRKEALACLNCFIDPMPGSLVAHMNSYLAGLSSLASDPSPNVRRLVCQGIVSLLSRRHEYIQPHISSIAEFMLRATSDTDPDVALEACEFWLTFASLDECSDEMMEFVVSLFPRLIPQLLKGIVYPIDKIEELMEANALDEDGGMDRAQDLAPVFHKSRVKGTHDDDSDDESEDEFDDDNEWTLRKCSAASLDALSGLYGATYTLPALLPALQEGLGHTDQWVREASILALGAIAEGCKDELARHLPQLHPFLLNQLSSSDSLPQLRCISAWTLGRFSSWVVDQMHDEKGDKALIGRVAEALVGRLLDRNKKVQVAVCSALGVFVESTGELMIPFLEPVFRALVKAMQMYRTRSLMVLFDTLGVMADYVGSAIGEGSLPGIYVPPLLKRWNDMAIENPFDRPLLPLMECLGSLTVACGMNFQPWALDAFEYSMSTIEACSLIIAHEDDLMEDDELADPVICSIDLIDGLVEALGGNFVALVNGSSRFGPTFANVLVGLSENSYFPGVRMSLFALLGDLARNAPSLIEAGLPKLLSEAISSIDPMHPAMCNNAVWAVGEVCVRCGENAGPLNPHAPNLLQKLIPLLMGNAVDLDGNTIDVHGIAENAATTMGRLASVNPNFVAPELPRFLHGWCTGMARVSNLIERRDAFQGFVLSLRANPQSIQSSGTDLPDTISAILFAVVSWHIPQDDMSTDLLHSTYGFKPFPHEFGELLNSLKQLLHDIKTTVGEASWSHVEGQMPVNVKRLMSACYEL